jgi:hypothetical protein
MSARISKATVAGFAITLALMVPILFIVSRGTVTTNQFVLIVCGVLGFTSWIVVYVKLVDPLLRRAAGALFGVAIETRGGRNGAAAWEPLESQGCLLEVFIGLLGYVCIALWLAAFAGAIGLVLWLCH